jgi:glucose-1-phosphate thymidylyltransferase
MINDIPNLERHHDVIGLLPAGGHATRLAPLPCSKELLPIGFGQGAADGETRPKVVSHYLLESMRMAGITKAYFVLRGGKWDIPGYFLEGKMLNMHLAYLAMRFSPGVPYTLDHAYPFVQHAMVAFGFPDILFQPREAVAGLLNRQAETNADIVLALFPVAQPHKWDMVELSSDGRIRKIFLKPSQSDLQHTWIIAVWTPVFSRFMHEYLIKIQETDKPMKAEYKSSEQRELFMGEVIQQAIDDGLQVEGLIFPEGTCLDVGTVDDLAKAVRNKNCI